MSRQGVARPRSLANVKEFWNAEAAEWGDNPQVTIRDHYFRLLEMGVIANVIRGRREVLDIGCGTGFSTLFYSQYVERITGADYAEQMVVWARRLLEDDDYFQATMRRFAPDGIPQRKGNLRFEEGNILDLHYPDAAFDAVVGERVLINLPERELQAVAIREVARVLQPSGVWACLEVTEQGHARVDRMRRLLGIGPIEKYWHNLYVDEDHLAETTEAAGFRIEAVERFETFQFLTKVVHPLAVAPEEPRFLAGFNDAARRIAQEYPTCASVARVGLERFLRHQFRPLLERLDPEKLPGYDRAVDAVVRAQPDFTACSHQVLFVLRKVS